MGEQLLNRSGENQIDDQGAVVEPVLEEAETVELAGEDGIEPGIDVGDMSDLEKEYLKAMYKKYSSTDEMVGQAIELMSQEELREKGSELAVEWAEQVLVELAPQYAKSDFVHPSMGSSQVQEMIKTVLGERVGLDYDGWHSGEKVQAMVGFLDGYVDFCLDTLEAADGSEREAVRKSVLVMNSLVFGGSPSLANWAGGIDGMVRLAARCNGQPDMRESAGERIVGEVVYQIAGNSQVEVVSEGLVGLLAEKNGLERIETMEVLSQVARRSLGEGGWAGSVWRGVRERLREMSRQEKPMVAMSADVAWVEVAQTMIRYGYVIDPEDLKLVEELESRGSWDEQLEFDDRFGSWVTIARGCKAPVDDWGYIQGIVWEGDGAHRLRLEEVTDDERINPLGVSMPGREGVLLQQLHRPEMRGRVEEVLGVELSEVSLASQIHLLRFMVEADQDQLGRLKQVMDRHEGARIGLLESFLALEMGDEFGEILLEIAESVDGEQLGMILGCVADIRESMRVIANRFDLGGRGDGYAKGINLATVKRVTEVLSVIPSLAREEGVVAVSPYMRGTAEVKIGQIEHPIAVLKLLNKALQSMASDMQEVPQQNYVEKSDPSLNHVVFESGNRMTIRPHASEVGEARMSFSVALTMEDLIECGYALADDDMLTTQERKLTIRLDLEESTGLLSLDMGTIEVKDGQKMRFVDLLVGLVVTAGAQEMARRRDLPIDEANNHVREAFDPDLANPARYGDYLENVKYSFAPVPL